MKTNSFIASIVLLVISTGLNAQNFDFRNTKWGMDSLAVKKAEVSTLQFSKKKSLVYNGKLGDIDARIVYDFTSSNKLYHAAYYITLDEKNPQQSVNTFLLLQESLTKKYKDPYLKLISTINGKVLKQEEWASNLISDNLNFETKWKTDKTNISLSLFSINDVLCIEINYYSIENDSKNSEERKALIYKEL